MTLAYDGSSVDGSVYLDVVDLARRAPGWLDDLVSAWSTYGLLLFALLMIAAWWQARSRATSAAAVALTAPLITMIAFGVNDLVKLAVRENRPCQSLRAITLEACPASGDWSFPSNHSALAAAAAVALLFASRRLGIVALVAAVLMAASRVWVGVHYPHDVLAGLAVGTLVALPLAWAVRTQLAPVAEQLASTRLRPLLATS
ncbi:phosphatase PAP2 family protein [Streptomyces sp. NPDC088725]|uniref:phosphatase PAP2 family protein n=1 Tax=Streptomyces sp. NPDC088725 TaxID=3365873 RepID=UPI00380212C7